MENDLVRNTRPKLQTLQTLNLSAMLPHTDLQALLEIQNALLHSVIQHGLMLSQLGNDLPGLNPKP